MVFTLNNIVKIQIDRAIVSMQTWGNITMQNFMKLGIASKVQIAVQLLLLLVSIATAFTFYSIERDSIQQGEEDKIKVLADGVINGANMLMINGIISDVDQRKLFIKKMGSSEGVTSLRIIRNKLVQQQFGQGLPEEQPVGEDERRALDNGQVFFKQQGNQLHGIVPYTESKGFRGTNCLMCHNVPVGYHNGASVINLDISANNEKLNKFIWLSIAVIVVVQIFLWLLIKFILRKLVADPARQLQTTMLEISNTGDFTRRVVVGSKDEIGQTASAFNDLIGNLQNTFRELHEGIEKVAESSHFLLTSSQQVANSSANQSEAASAMSATVEEVTVSISHVSEGASEALVISRNSGNFSEQGGEIIYHAAEEMKRISGTVRKSSLSIKDLEEQSNQISFIVRVIKEIADQTNLLALNAAIEAARAGEQGRGFAVVADEVRNLANRTTKAIAEIKQLISNIQTASQAAVDNMAATVIQVDGGVTLAQQAGDAISQIKAGSTQVVKTVSDISSALVEQSAASNNIAVHIEKVAQMAEENSAAAVKTADAANQLAQLAKEMRITVNRFKT